MLSWMLSTFLFLNTVATLLFYAGILVASWSKCEILIARPMNVDWLCRISYHSQRWVHLILGIVSLIWVLLMNRFSCPHIIGNSLVVVEQRSRALGEGARVWTRLLFADVLFLDRHNHLLQAMLNFSILFKFNIVNPPVHPVQIVPNVK